MNIQYLENVMNKAGLPQEAIQSLMNTARNLTEEQIKVLDEGLVAYQNDTFFDLNHYCDLIDERFECNLEAQLIFSFLLTEHTEKLYQAAGMEEKMFMGVLDDFVIKCDECYKFYGRYGTFVVRWFYRWFRLQRISLERLQFEVRDFGHVYKNLSEKSPAINVHIPASGPLDHDACLRDYKRAAEIFADYFDTQVVFMCHSWLLHPEHPDFLPPTSRLLAFQEDYDIIAFDEDKEGEFLWRLYGVPYDGNPEHLTERNSLERAYKKHILAGGKIGEGFGVFIYQKP